MARAPLVAFTDDDCRPEPGWLAALLAGAARHPGAIVQGTTRPDPFELDLLAAPHARSLWVDPPGPFGQTANILYPRELLERLEGFDETFLRPAGEDTDLLWRAKELGASLVAAPDAVVNHAVAAFTALGMVRLTPKWLDLPRVVGRHPGLRKTFPLGRFWRERHGWLLLGTLGSLATRSTTARLLLALPYLRLALARDGARLRSLPRAVAELPGRVAVDFAELAVLTAGSIRHRTMFL
jgi:cellulose synthase/poly-beta-1,6-N-acetylglucosamine synthase-like glycosyltransferase